MSLTVIKSVGEFRKVLVRLGLGAIAASALTMTSGVSIAIAQSNEALCPTPALAKLQTHTVVAGETLDTIAATYNLLPVTLMAMNSAAQAGVRPGMTLRIPPFNGAEVRVTAGQTWQDLAVAYRVRADVLFEVNGCPEAVPSLVFVPGVSWLLESQAPSADTSNNDPLSKYPLAEEATIIANYGWQTDPILEELVFSSGITLELEAATAVTAAGSGTVAYVGEEEALGTLIVINHAQGLQTRYAQIIEPLVKAGDAVQAGQHIATMVQRNEESALLYFEVRTNSTLGWVARNPGDYIPELAVR